MTLKRNYKPYIFSEAKYDIQEAVFWYDAQQKGLGKNFISKVRECIQGLIPNPYICQNRYKNVHTAIVKNYPFMIHYTIDNNKEIFTVLAVIHTSKNPEVWSKRSE
jgi:plasmid stabilization system protein ParE